MTAARYERQVILPQVGEAGQERLGASSALVVGCGGLGSVLLYCLSGMGVGRIGFCDGDVVAESNLNRQFLYSPSDIGKKKAHLSFDKLRTFAPELTLEPHDAFITANNAASLVSRYDVVLLAVDTIEARLAVNNACVAAHIPLVDAGVNGFHGSVFTVRPDTTACLACLYGDLQELQAVAPSFAPVVSVIASFEAQCAANILLDLPNPTDGRMLVYDAASLSTEFVSIARNPHCTVCGS